MTPKEMALVLAEALDSKGTGHQGPGDRSPHHPGGLFRHLYRHLHHAGEGTGG